MQFIFIFLLFINSCIVNPKYTTSQEIAEEQIQKTPQDADQIKQYQKDFESLENLKKSSMPDKYSYRIDAEKTSGWSIGNPNALLHVGQNKYKYTHKLNIGLICNKNNFVPSYFSQKNIKWKINDSFTGTTTTQLTGDFQIQLTHSEPTRFENIFITTQSKTYKFSLSQFLLYELDPAECNK